MSVALGVVMVLGLLAALGCHALLPVVADLARRGGAVRPNYAGEPLPVSLGAAAALPVITVMAAAVVLGLLSPALGLAVTFVGLSMVLVGWLDDQWGDGSVRGLRSHWAAAARGHWTTGGLKAVVGLVAGLLGGWLLAPSPWPYTLLAAGVIGASANGINLFDLRPGRAWKCLLLAWGLLLIVRIVGLGRDGAALAEVDPALALIAVNLGALAVYGPWDLGARGMMGDAGANGLGALLGIGMVLSLSPQGLLVALLGWVALHVAGERVSFSAWIDKTPLLRRLDAWGRRKT